jgi:hypothetical protein
MIKKRFRKSDLDSSDARAEESSHRALWVEIGVVVALGILPDLYGALALVRWPQLSRNPPFAYDALFLVVRGIYVSAPVLYIIWRTGEP